MYKIGLTSGNGVIRDPDATFRTFKAGGIEAVEVSVAYEFNDIMDFKEVERQANKHGVKLWSFHLPFMPFKERDISKGDVADETVKYLTTLIEKAAGIGIDKIVIHPSGEPIALEDRPERMKVAKESLFKLVGIAGRNGAVIAVEDLPRTCLGNCSDEMEELISVDPSLRVCFDSNHLLGEDPVHFIKKMGNKIITTHISDYDFINERHWLPGEGKNDWQAIYKALKEVGYDGLWLYELGFGDTKNITRERNLTCEDFVRNANEIFEGRELTVIPSQKNV